MLLDQKPDCCSAAPRTRDDWSVAAETRDVLALGGSIYEAIRRKASGYVAEHPQGCTATVTIGDPLIVGHSVLFRYQAASGESSQPLQFFAKVRREWKGGPFMPGDVTAATVARTKNEYRLLCSAHKFYASQEPALSVARPLDYLDEFNALLVQQAAGAPLDRQVFQDKRGHAATQLRWCGKWLRLFHTELHEPHAVSWEPEEFLRRFDMRIGRILQRGVERKRVLPLVDAVNRDARQVSAQAIRRSVLHGDYKLRHIWASTQGIQPFDMGNSSVGDCQRDVAAFMVELVVMPLWNPWFSESRIRIYCNSFLDGYYGDEQVPPTLRFYIVEYLLKKWCRRLQRWGSSGMLNVLRLALELTGTARLVENLYLNRWFRWHAVSLCGAAESWQRARCGDSFHALTCGKSSID